MAKLSRQGDQDQKGRKIVRGANSVFANGKPVGLHVSEMNRRGKRKNGGAKTTAGSPTVFADGAPVLRTGTANTKGGIIIQGSPNVNVP